MGLFAIFNSFFLNFIDIHKMQVIIKSYIKDPIFLKTDFIEL